MTTAINSVLAQRFPFIVKWEERMSSAGYYRDQQLERAARDNAPSNAIYFSSVSHRWATTDDILNPEIVLAWQLKCPVCQGKRARSNGCNHPRHTIYDMANWR